MALSSSRCAMSVLGLFALALLAAVQPVSAPRAHEPPTGHFVFVVEGDVTALRVTHAVAKKDDWGGVPKGLRSEFALKAFDATGAEILSVPLDLSKFDTDPARVGGPVVVTGCEVRSPQVGTLVNVPALVQAARWEFSRGQKLLGVLDRAALERMLQEVR